MDFLAASAYAVKMLHNIPSSGGRAPKFYIGTRFTSAGTMIILTCVLCLAGCGKTTPAIHTSPPKTIASMPEPAITVEIANWQELQKRREKWKGKVVVVDVWSTDCQPCVREFPNLVSLQRHFGDRVICVSFATNYSGAKDEPPESFLPTVSKFLKNQDARFLNVLSSEPAEDFFNRIHLGGPPAVFVYDRAGELASRFDNSQVPKVPEFTYHRDIVPLVEKLVGR